MTTSETVTRSGRRFKAAGTEPYQRLDGTWTVLKLWLGTCGTCGTPFLVKTPGESKDSRRSHAFDRVHCDEHKRRRATR